MLDGARQFMNLIQWAEYNKPPSIPLLLDAEKAFDWIHWSYMRAVISKFGFPSCILSSITTLYSQPTAKVWTPGFMSPPFPITNGTRQGCPLSHQKISRHGGFPHYCILQTYHSLPIKTMVDSNSGFTLDTNRICCCKIRLKVSLRGYLAPTNSPTTIPGHC